jgi:hypothetical protein
MSSALITQIIDLTFIIDAEIYLSGSPCGIKEETYNNLWELSFDEKLISKLSKEDLHHFFLLLLEKRTEQIAALSNELIATLYLWFDEQSNQLCFNILSGKDIKLPFHCTIHTVNSIDIIFDQCLENLCHPALNWNNLEIIEPGDPCWNDNDEEDFDPKKYILNVYVATLNNRQ